VRHKKREERKVLIVCMSLRAPMSIVSNACCDVVGVSSDAKFSGRFVRRSAEEYRMTEDFRLGKPVGCPIQSGDATTPSDNFENAIPHDTPSSTEPSSHPSKPSSPSSS